MSESRRRGLSTAAVGCVAAAVAVALAAPFVPDSQIDTVTRWGPRASIVLMASAALLGVLASRRGRTTRVEPVRPALPAPRRPVYALNAAPVRALPAAPARNAAPAGTFRPLPIVEGQVR